MRPKYSLARAPALSMADRAISNVCELGLFGNRPLVEIPLSARILRNLLLFV